MPFRLSVKYHRGISQEFPKSRVVVTSRIALEHFLYYAHVSSFHPTTFSGYIVARMTSHLHNVEESLNMAGFLLFFPVTIVARWSSLTVVESSGPSSCHPDCLFNFRRKNMGHVIHSCIYCIFVILTAVGCAADGLSLDNQRWMMM